MGQKYDIVIIGGGIIGTSTAFHLANDKLKIAIINSTSLGTPASVAAAGLFQIQLGELENPILKTFCIDSFEYFLNFFKELQTYELIKNIDLGFKQVGSLYLIRSSAEIAHKELEVNEIKNHVRASFLNKRELTKYEPRISKDIIGAYHFPDEGFINNTRFLKAITSICIDKKVSFIKEEVIKINLSNNKITNILLSNEETVGADTYLLCNGAWANKLLNKLQNINIIKGIKGEIIQIAIPDNCPIERVIFCHDGYILPRPRTNNFEVNSLIAGGTSEEVNLEEKNTFVFNNTISGIGFLTKLIQELLPGCKNYPIIKAWSGVRPTTLDNIPVISESEITNLFYGLGHYRNGILMGPLTGKILRDLIVGKNQYNIEPFKISRFLTNTKARDSKIEKSVQLTSMH